MHARIAVVVFALLSFPVWGAISLEDTTYFQNSSNSVNCRIPQPTGGQDDDVMIAFQCKDDQQDSVPQDGVWVEIMSQGDTGGTDRNFSMWHRVITDWTTEDSTYDEYNWTSDSELKICGMWLLRGVDTSTPIDVAAAVGIHENDDSPSNTSVETVTANAWAIHALCTAHNSGDQSAVTSPVGPTEVWAAGHSSSGGVYINASYEEHPSAGPVASEEWTSSGSRESISVMVGIRPVVAAGGGRRRVTTP